MAERTRIPVDIETRVLSQSGRRCCICFGLNGDLAIKQGQIAHLDRNNQNHNFDNLAFLCLEHHDCYDTRTSQSKGWTIGEVKAYRGSLYQVVSEVRESPRTISEKPKRTELVEEKGFLIGERLKETREELNLQTSEFVELIGFNSEKLYLQMEANEQECKEFVILQICEATGILPEWLKHGRYNKCEVDGLWWWRDKPHEAAQAIADISSGLVYVTVAATTHKSDVPLFRHLKDLYAAVRDQYLHVGVCVPEGRFRYKVYDLYLCIDFWRDFKAKYIPPFYAFLGELVEHFDFDVRGVIISNWKDEDDLYNGRVHPEKIIAKYYHTHDTGWVHAILDFEQKRYDGLDYWWRYGEWITKVQAELRKSLPM